MQSTKPSLKEAEQQLLERASRSREAAFQRFPLLFTLLTTFGVVATFYGFEGIIDRIDFLSRNPLMILGTGVGVLAATGALYKKLQ